MFYRNIQSLRAADSGKLVGFKRCNDACRECLQRVPHTLVVGGDYRDQLKLRCHVDKLPADSESFEAMYALGGFYKLGVPEKEQKEKDKKKEKEKKKHRHSDDDRGSHKKKHKKDVQ
jgi:hypothetical protein